MMARAGKRILAHWRLVLGLFVAWLIVTGICAYRVQTEGAFSTHETTKLFEYAKHKYHTDPGSLRLNQSYTRWAVNVPPSDAFNYLRTGLGFADGHGLNIKLVTLDDPNSHTYIPYYHQGPGTPVAIGLFIKAFGQDSVLPYFLFISIVHLGTAILTCILASLYLEEPLLVFGAGLLSLVCLPAVDSNLGIGFFWSEPLAAPFVVASLIAAALFWRNKARSYKITLATGLGFGISLAIGSYFRDVYTTFLQFSLAVFLLASCFERRRLKHIFLFALVSMIALSVIQLPWKKRNQWYFREFSMSGTTYCGAGLWALTWDNSRDTIPEYSGGIGLGSYLAPEKSAVVLQKLQEDRKQGGTYAFKCLLDAILKRPWDAVKFKLNVYDALWLGQPSCPYIYLWCVIASASFIIFLFVTGFAFEPGLWLFPLFLFCISPIIQYEHRYAQPFFLFVTPITTMYFARKFLYAKVLARQTDKAKAHGQNLAS
ncbi:MAG TPA: hypothetical protein V6C97_24120 [Oculatellaceae cyanobacterium]